MQALGQQERSLLISKAPPCITAPGCPSSSHRYCPPVHPCPQAQRVRHPSAGPAPAAGGRLAQGAAQPRARQPAAGLLRSIHRWAAGCEPPPPRACEQCRTADRLWPDCGWGALDPAVPQLCAGRNANDSGHSTKPAPRLLPAEAAVAHAGGGAALWAAAQLGSEVKAVVSRGGRPDLAMQVPTPCWDKGGLPAAWMGRPRCPRALAGACEQQLLRCLAWSGSRCGPLAAWSGGRSAGVTLPACWLTAAGAGPRAVPRAAAGGRQRPRRAGAQQVGGSALEWRAGGARASWRTLDAAAACNVPSSRPGPLLPSCCALNVQVEVAAPGRAGT
jgi:hypothetical protein